MLICLDRVTGNGCGQENPDGATQCQKCGMSLRYALELHNPGDVVGQHYRIVRVIGFGGFGAVFAAEVIARPDLQVALKETFNPASVRGFQREFQALHRMQHDHLPKYHHMFEANGNGYLVMELVPGQSLLDVFNSKNAPLLESVVVGYAMQVCDVLTFLHSQNPPLIHRDIKPANIRLTPDGLIKLVDFGLLKQGTDATGTSRMGLSPGYAPLEQWGGAGAHTSPSSDIYSLGATLYHLLTAQTPPAATDRVAVKPDPLVSPRQHNARVSEHVAHAIMRALAIVPEERFQDAAAFKQALVETRAADTGATLRIEQPPTPTAATNQPALGPTQRVQTATETVQVAPPSNPMYTQALDESSEEEPEPRRTSTTKRKKKKTPVLLWVGGGALVVLALAIVMVLALVWGGQLGATVYYKNGRTLFDENKYDEAIVAFTKAIELNQTHAAAYTERGYAYYVTREYDLAGNDFDATIAIDPEYADAYAGRGIVYYRNGDGEEKAYTQCDQSLALDPKSARGYYCRGRILDSIDDLTRAIELGYKPLSRAYMLRGFIYDEQEEYDRAIADFNKAIELENNKSDFYVIRGNAYYEQGLYDRAIADFNKAIELDNNNSVFYVIRGDFYKEQGEYDRAIADYTKAIKLDADSASAYYRRGVVYKEMEQEDKAIADFIRCIELEKDSFWAILAEWELEELGIEP